MKISTLRGWLYGFAKFLGDIQAIQKGPKAIERRIGRRLAGKFTRRLLGKLFR